MLKKNKIIINFFTIISIFLFSFIKKEKSEKINGISIIIGDEIILDSELNKEKKNSLNKKFYYGKDNIFINDDFLVKKMMIYHAKKKINKCTENEDECLKKFYETITSNIEVYPYDIKDFFIKNKNNILLIKPRKYCISYMIFFPKKSDYNRNKMFLFMKKIRKKIIFGENLEKIIEKCNSEKFKVKSDKLKKIEKKFFLEKKFRIFFSKKKEWISQPFENIYGFHILKIERNKKNEINLIHIYARKQYSKYEILRAKSIANIFRKKLLKSDRLDLKNNNKKIEKNVDKIFLNKKTCFDENKIPKFLLKKTRSLKINEISYPFLEKINNNVNAIFVVKLDNIKNTKNLNLISIKKDYNIVKLLTEESKKRNKIKKWVEKMLKKTFIKVNI